MSLIKIALAQVHPVLDDVEANLATMRRARAQAAANQADVIVFPQLAIAGSPPGHRQIGGLLLESAAAALETLARDTADGGPAMLVGLPMSGENGQPPLNAAALLHGGRMLGRCSEVGRSDRFRGAALVFAQAPVPGPLALPCGGGPPIRLGVMIGQDVDAGDVAEALAETGAEILIVLAACPYGRGSFDRRQQAAVQRVAETGLPLICVNPWGGQKERVFDGGSFALDDRCRLIALAPEFDGRVLSTDWQRTEDGPLASMALAERVAPLDQPCAIYRALMLSVREDLAASQATQVTLALADDLASVLLAVLAVDAVGPSRVSALVLAGPDMQPGRASTICQIAGELGIDCDVIPTSTLLNDAVDRLDRLPGQPTDISMVARHLHGGLLEAAAERAGARLLSPLDKSTAMLCPDPGPGSYAPFKDLFETELQAIGRWRRDHAWSGDASRHPGTFWIDLLNRTRDMPAGLPPQPDLDEILRMLSTDGSSISAAPAGIDPETLALIRQRVSKRYRSRRDEPPGPVLAVEEAS